MKKRILSIVIILVMTLGFLPTVSIANAATSGKCGDNLTWNINNKVLTISGTGEMYNYFYYDGPPWSNITEVVIENGVTSIGNYAFCECLELTSITIPKSVTSIGEGAFRGSYKLSSVTIPEGVTSIGNYAFYYCSQLTSINIPNNLTSIPKGMLGHCYNITTINIPDNVISIGDSAFLRCDSLTSVTISNNLTSIGCDAFGYCKKLSSINVPNNVKTIGTGAFKECVKLQDKEGYIIFNNIIFGYYGSDTNIKIREGIESISESSFANCKNITSVIIPNTVTFIGSSAFSDCTNLETINIPDGITSIKDSTFYNCSSLKSIVIPNSVTSIGSNAFSYCSSLNSINIPYGITAIKDYTFYYCSGLRTINIPNTVRSLREGAFYGCSSVSTVNYCGTKEERDMISNKERFDLLYESTWIYQDHNYDNTCDASCNLCGYARETVHKYGEYISDYNATTEKDGTKTRTCSECGYKDTVNDIGTKLPTTKPEPPVTSGSCGENVTWSFDATTGTLTIGGTGEMSNDWGFEYVLDGGLAPWYDYKDDIKTVVIQDGVTSIGNAAFAKCKSLENITIPNSVISIGDCTFAECVNLKSIAISSSVTLIKRMAFISCQNLSTVNYSGTEADREKIEIGAFNDELLNAKWLYNGESTSTVEIKDTSAIFTDIKAKAWYKQYVDYSVAYGIFTGTSANTFSPNSNITRAQFVQVLANLSGIDTTNRNVQTEFSDVPAKKWYTAAVKWASENKIVNGMGGGKFAPNNNVTREQMCLMLVNYAKFNNLSLNEVEARASFADDAKISKWAKSAVYTCQMADIVNGKGAGKFDPQGTGTRAEACVMFTKFHKDYMAK